MNLKYLINSILKGISNVRIDRIVNNSFGERNSFKNSGTLHKAFESKALFVNFKNIKNI